VIDAAVVGAPVLQALRAGGTLVTVRDVVLPQNHGMRVERVRVAGVGDISSGLERLRALCEAGVLLPRVARVLPMEAAAEAHRLMERGGHRGRLVLDLRRDAVRR
jgi:NADPH2:quinone reductase